MIRGVIYLIEKNKMIVPSDSDLLEVEKLKSRGVEVIMSECESQELDILSSQVKLTVPTEVKRGSVLRQGCLVLLRGDMYVITKNGSTKGKVKLLSIQRERINPNNRLVEYIYPELFWEMVSKRHIKIIKDIDMAVNEFYSF